MRAVIGISLVKTKIQRIFLRKLKFLKTKYITAALNGQKQSHNSQLDCVSSLIYVKGGGGETVRETVYFFISGLNRM